MPFQNQAYMSMANVKSNRICRSPRFKSKFRTTQNQTGEESDDEL